MTNEKSQECREEQIQGDGGRLKGGISLSYFPFLTTYLLSVWTAVTAGVQSPDCLHASKYRGLTSLTSQQCSTTSFTLTIPQS